MSPFQQQLDQFAADVSAALQTIVPAESYARAEWSRPNDPQHGDAAWNGALVSAKALRKSPRDIAAQCAAVLENHSSIDSVDVAGPGFLNIRFSVDGWLSFWRNIQSKADQQFKFPQQKGKTLVEFVSANPTGPLHVGHGRGAAVGDSIARILRRTGHDVTCEYYVNDAGLQIDNLGKSVVARVAEIETPDQPIDFPDNGYEGAYVYDIAKQWIADDRPGLGDDRAIGQYAGEKIRQGIEQDLQGFGVTFDDWFSEQTLHDSTAIDDAIAALAATGHTFEQDGALWFRSTEYGDTKDRVVRRSNGVLTYFAADIAYHHQKIQRGFTELVNVWGADHHGYIPRVQGAMQALGLAPQALDVVLIQFVSLVRDGEPLQMSTRRATYETLDELCERAGYDATRFFYLQRRSDTHLEFDLALAERQDAENPVYYTQYAHARCCALEAKIEVQDEGDKLSVADLDSTEQNLLWSLDRYDAVLDNAAVGRAPHLVAHYLWELAACLHKFYNACPIANAEPEIQQRRLRLVQWTRAILADGLEICGVSAPTSM